MMPRQPNVILIMADQFRADALGCAGNRIVQTPNLDALAAGGVMFGNAYTQCPVCMASRAAIHTGRYPRALRVPSMGILPPEEITIAQTLKRNGYRTGMFGKLHFTPQSYTQKVFDTDKPLGVEHFLGPAGIDTPWARAAAEDPMKRNYGFDESVGVEDMLWGHWLEWLETRSPDHVKFAAAENWGKARAGIKFADAPSREMFPGIVSGCIDSRVPAELSASRFIAERSIDFIRRNAGQPFFMHCSFVDPHDPFNAPEPYNRMYKPADMPTPPLEDFSTYPSPLRGGLAGAINRTHGFPDEVWRWIRANYYGMISNIDNCIGRLVSALEETGQRENTIIVFTSDHGEYAGGHRLLYKGPLLYDDVMRVPFIFNWPSPPGVPASQPVTGLVQEIDIYPTIMSLLGLPIHDGVQGHDLTPLLREEIADPAHPARASAGDMPSDTLPIGNSPIGGARRSGPPWGNPPASGRPGAARPVHAADPAYDRVYCELDDLPSAPMVASVAVRTREWKLNYLPHTGSGMMFNLAEDPDERVNLYDDPGYTRERQELTAELLDMYDVMKDPLPHRLTQA